MISDFFRDFIGPVVFGEQSARRGIQQSSLCRQEDKHTYFPKGKLKKRKEKTLHRPILNAYEIQ